MTGMQKLNLNVPINSLGYGVVGYNVWKELNKTNDITLWPMNNQVGPPVAVGEQEVYQLNIDIGKQDDFDPTVPCLKIWHENQLAERIGTGPMTNLSFFETNEFNARRKSHLQSVDRIVVPSQWAANIVIDQLDLKFDYKMPHIVPMGVDRDLFNEDFNIHSPYCCVFFNCGKWEVRKGHDILRQAFCDAFPDTKDVELWMMNENPFLNGDERRQWEAKYKGDRRIQLLNRVKHQEELATVMSKVDCGIFPARAEGWNLELLELMSIGKHVIATNYSGHTAFCTEDNCRLIEITETEPMYDGKWFKGDCGTWASLDGDPYDQLVSHLQNMYRQWQCDPKVLNEEGIKTAQEHTWERTAASLMEIATHEC